MGRYDIEKIKMIQVLCIIFIQQCQNLHLLIYAFLETDSTSGVELQFIHIPWQ